MRKHNTCIYFGDNNTQRKLPYTLILELPLVELVASEFAFVLTTEKRKAEWYENKKEPTGLRKFLLRKIYNKIQNNKETEDGGKPSQHKRKQCNKVLNN